MLDTFNAAQFWISIAIAIAPASFVTFHVARVYARRSPALRFGRIGSTVVLTLIWLAFFIPIARLSLYAWA